MKETVASKNLEYDVSNSVRSACQALLKAQKSDGHWCFELEADCTIPAEYVLMTHFLDEIDVALEQKIAAYLRAKQNDEGGWPLYFGGKSDISCTVKVYYALKLIGDSVNDSHMMRARQYLLQVGGAANANVFTRITLALFNQVPWRAVPFMPVEIILLPRWFPFHLSKVSYWSRTVMVPLLILCTLKPSAKNPRKIDILELFTVPPNAERQYFKVRSALNRIFLVLDKLGRMIEPLIPKTLRKKAIAKAEKWFTERLNGEDGLGAIFPALVNAYEALHALGYEQNHTYSVQARRALQKSLVVNEQSAYCQPALSPVWDTGLSILALQEEGSDESQKAAEQASNWLLSRQILSGPADWREYNPNLPPGGWPFEYRNDYYPDLDDTAAVAWALEQQNSQRYEECIERAANWLVGMQSRNGGFASFDKNNMYFYLNEIPFADHGSLLDPPSADVSARCITFLSRLGRQQDRDVIDRGVDFLLREQEQNGSWYGRWGTNYIYGTWSVLIALNATGMDANHPVLRKAAEWLKSKQRVDGGWGENNDSYFDVQYDEQDSTSYQTAWALLGLMAAGEVKSQAVTKGIHYLISTQSEGGFWEDSWFNAPGFPRVFFLNYHGYRKYFPLWALAKYHRLLSA